MSDVQHVILCLLQSWCCQIIFVVWDHINFNSIQTQHFYFFFLICSITYFIQISSMTFINALFIFHSEARRGDVQKAEKHWWRESKGTREQDSPALPEHHIHIVCLLHPPAKHIIDVELLEDNGNVSIERKYADSVKNSSVFQWREEIRLDIANSEGVTSSCL